MKTLAFITALTCLPIVQLSAQPARSTPRLVGIVNLPERKSVLLEIGGSRPGPSRLTVLSEGERDAFVDVELLHINAEHGSVELRVAKTNVVVASFDEASAASARTNTIVLTNAPLSSLLDLYARCSGRTLLQSPVLQNCLFQTHAAPANQAEAALVFEKALAAQDITIVPDGGKFAFVVPKAHVNFVHPRSSEIKPAAPPLSATEMIPAGAVVFVGIDFMQAASTYANMSGRKIKQASWPRDIPNPNFFFKNQTALTKAEMIYAFDMMFELSRLKMVPDGDEFLKPELIRLK